MILRHLHGLAFRVISPSFYELASHPEIDVSYLGDAWWLQCPDTRGEPRFHDFKSLDDAARFVALGVLGEQA